MDKNNLREKRDIFLNPRKIIFIAILVILLLIITSILLLIWWPNKATWSEITNSWVSLIVVYLVIILLLFARPIYNLYNELFDLFTKSGKNQAKQTKQQALSLFITPEEFQQLVSYQDKEWEGVLKKEALDPLFIDLENSEINKYVKKIQKMNLYWRFLFADATLVFNAKYVLFWLFKVKLAKLEEFNKLWQSRIEDEQERRAIIEALTYLDFIKKEEDELIITELGAAYVNYLKELDKYAQK